MRANLLNLRQEFELLLLLWLFVEDGVGLGGLVGLREFVVLRGVVVDLQDGDTGVVHFLRVGVQGLDHVLDHCVGHHLSAVLVWALHWEVRALG